MSHGSFSDPTGHVSMEKRAVLSSVSFFRLEFSSLEEDILVLSVVLQYNNNSNTNNKKMEISLWIGVAILLSAWGRDT